jgi:hypothetical protein
VGVGVGVGWVACAGCWAAPLGSVVGWIGGLRGRGAKKTAQDKATINDDVREDGEDNTGRGKGGGVPGNDDGDNGAGVGSQLCGFRR